MIVQVAEAMLEAKRYARHIEYRAEQSAFRLNA